MSDFWEDFYTRVQPCVEENFWGNLKTLQKARLLGDSYAIQITDVFGAQLGTLMSGSRRCNPYSFKRAIERCIDLIQDRMVGDGLALASEVIIPGKAFRQTDGTLYIVEFGGSVPEGAEPLNLLMPNEFVHMLSSGYFPIGEAIREHTNQSLAEHDLAHVSGFVKEPLYMRSVRSMFVRVQQLTDTHPRVDEALQIFDSLYSLRLYYAIEVFTIIRPLELDHLQALLGDDLSLDMDFADIVPNVSKKLLSLGDNPVELYKYLNDIYCQFYSLVNPLGGESRDIINRRRKFRRSGANLVTFYSEQSRFVSKFDGNSIYSLAQNAQAALENVRSDHENFTTAIREIHTVFIGALIGTSKLAIDDWVGVIAEPVISKNCKLYKYFTCGLWAETDLLRLVHTHADYWKTPEQVVNK